MDRIEQLESRLAATDARLASLVEALYAYHKPDAPLGIYSELMSRLAALRAPGVGAEACEGCAERDKEIEHLKDCAASVPAVLNGEVITLRDALTTARRERDEAVGVLRDWLDAWERSSEIRPLSDLLTRARAIVKGEPPEPRHRNEGPGGCVPWEEAERLRAQLAEREAGRLTAHISQLESGAELAMWKDQAGHAEALRDEVSKLTRERDCWNNAHAELSAHLSSVTAARNTALARVAELEARDRLLMPTLWRWHNGSGYDDRLHALLDEIAKSATPPDPARGLIERAAKGLGSESARRCEDLCPCWRCRLAADLRAYLGGG